MGFKSNETRAFWNQFPEGASISGLREQKLISEPDQHEFIDKELEKQAKAEAGCVVELPAQAMGYAGEILVQAS